jgi:two-component system, NtrC family, response regulator GlrR
MSTSAPGLGQPLDREFAQLNLLGEAPAFVEQLQIIQRIAAVDVTTLIQGETGTGKELAARALHYLGPRRAHPFIPVNCGALPETLVESELFGHERGAFTDAKESSRGLVAQAEGGTLFLDEVEAMAPRAQVVLLRFLQDHSYRPIGGRAVVRGNVRIIASSNIRLDELVSRHEFRRDLLFRFDILSITMPPLRERVGDAVLLAEHFLRCFAKQYKRPVLRLHAETVAWMRTYDWPGNVRELENVVLRAFLLSDSGDVLRVPSPMTPGASPATRVAAAADEPFKSAKARAVAEFERTYLRDLLARTQGNVSLAARISRKDRSALNRLARKHGIAGDQFRA